MLLMNYEKKPLLMIGLIICACFILGILIGTFAINKGSSGDIIEDKFENKNFVTDVLNKVDSNNLGDFLKVLTEEPHIAASDRDRYEMKQSSDNFDSY